jgi:Phosphotransferase enzyme family
LGGGSIDRRMALTEPEFLSDGKVGTAGVVRIGNMVRRRPGPGAVSIHRLLSLMTSTTLEFPKPLLLGDSVEDLTFVPGDTARLTWDSWMQTDDVLVSVASSLRALHDLTRPFAETIDGPWWRWERPDGELFEPREAFDVIRHGDPWPANIVFRNGAVVGWIDFDLAQPGRAIDDVAALAKHWVPLMSDARAQAHGWLLPVDRARRLRLLADAYGLDASSRAELLDAAIDFAITTAISHRRWAAAGQPSFSVMVARGVTDAIEADGRWLAAHRSDVGARL